VPPLRERIEDIELLAEHFLAELNKGARTPKAFTPAAVERLKRYSWPGNVRELWNVVQRAFIMSDGEWITQVGLSAEPTLNAEPTGRSFQVSVGDRIDAVEKRLILATVQHTQTKEAAAISSSDMGRHFTPRNRGWFARRPISSSPRREW